MGAGWEAISAWEAALYWFPGTDEVGVRPESGVEEPYIYKFPDGNASIARALVRYLIPDAIPGDTMEDLVTARANYALLDQVDSPIRIRLNSTAVQARNTPDGEYVDVAYVCEGLTHRVRARHTVMACYNQMIPHLCPEATAAQSAAIAESTKIPFVLGTFALRNWQAFKDAGYYHFYSPGEVMFQYLRLDFPVSLGDYQYAQNPDQPIVVTAWHSPREPGLAAKDQYRAGRAKLLQMSYEEFEQDIIRVLKPYEIDLIALAGFMRILSPLFVRHYKNKILNIHPALLPSFPGMHAARQALEYGVKFTGCTVHFVDEGVDTGPIIQQSVVSVLEDDTEESLQERIQKEEYRIYPEAVKLVAEGKVKIP